MSRYGKAAARASEDIIDDDNDSLNFRLIGTPLDIDEIVHQQKKQSHQSLHPSSASAAGGKAVEGRFHGAFTGGFSAGYFNTVGSAEGWTPSIYRSSRTQRAERKERSVLEYMDEEDKKEEINEKTLFVNQDITGSNISNSTTGKSKGYDLLVSSLSLSKESVPIQLMRRMGWREGKGVGRKRKRTSTSKLSAQKKKVYSVTLPPSMQALEDEELDVHVQDGRGESSVAVTRTNEPEEEADNNFMQHFSFTPSDTNLYVIKRKDDLYGLGFDPLASALEFRTTKKDSSGSGREIISIVDDESEEDEVMEIQSKSHPPKNGIKSRTQRHQTPDPQKSLPSRFASNLLEDDEADIDLLDEEQYSRPLYKHVEAPPSKTSNTLEAHSNHVLHSMYGQLEFVRDTSSASNAPADVPFTILNIPPDYTGMHMWNKVETEIYGNSIVKEYGEIMKKERNRVLTVEERRELLGEKQLPILKEGKETVNSSHNSLPIPTVKNPLPTPSMSTEARDALSSSFFSNFEVASTSSPIGSNEALKEESTIVTNSSLSSSTQDKKNILPLRGQLYRTIENWTPVFILARRFNVVQLSEKSSGKSTVGSISSRGNEIARTIIREGDARLTDTINNARVAMGQSPIIPSSQITSNSSTEPKVKPVVDMDEGKSIREPPLPPTVKPPINLFKSIFESDDDDDEKEQEEKEKERKRIEEAERRKIDAAVAKSALEKKEIWEKNQKEVQNTTQSQTDISTSTHLQAPNETLRLLSSILPPLQSNHQSIPVHSFVHPSRAAQILHHSKSSLPGSASIQTKAASFLPSNSQSQPTLLSFVHPSRSGLVPSTFQPPSIIQSPQTNQSRLRKSRWDSKPIPSTTFPPALTREIIEEQIQDDEVIEEKTSTFSKRSQFSSSSSSPSSSINSQIPGSLSIYPSPEFLLPLPTVNDRAIVTNKDGKESIPISTSPVASTATDFYKQEKLSTLSSADLDQQLLKELDRLHQAKKAAKSKESNPEEKKKDKKIKKEKKLKKMKEKKRGKEKEKKEHKSRPRSPSISSTDGSQSVITVE